MVKEYIKVRVDAKPEKELPPEEALKAELWALLDETEKENRRKQYQIRQKADKDAAAVKRDK